MINSEADMIYCVEDDDGIRNMMIYTLKASGFGAEGFESAEGLYAGLKREIPELIMLDIMLPGEDGLSILRRLKNSAETADVPVIMTTAKGTEYDKVVGLDAGADDYLAKPFGMMEMVSRVKAILRRSGRNGADKEIISAGDLTINHTERKVFVCGERVVLTLKEYELIRYLAKNAGVVFTREQLLFAIWGEEFLGETRTIDVHVATLRTKLGKCGECVKTVRGVGYKFEV